MEHLSSNVEQQNQDQQVQWRRGKVEELSKGYSQSEISQTLQVGSAKVNSNISHLRDEPRQSVFMFRKVQIHNPCIYKMK
jgi:hypothetical protein